LETAERFEPEEGKASSRPAPDFALIDRAVRRSRQPGRSEPAAGTLHAIDDKLKTV
jgi:hypothetical protein